MGNLTICGYTIFSCNCCGGGDKIEPLAIMNLYHDIGDKGKYIMCLVSQSEFESRYNKTEFCINYKKTTKDADPLQAVNSLCEILPDNAKAFKQIYEEYNSDPEIMITKIWTYEPSEGEIRLSQFINIAYCIDAMSVFNSCICNINLTDEYSFIDLISEAKVVIQKASPFIRLLCKFINDGKTNEDKSVYFGSPLKFSKDLKDEEIYRVITCSFNKGDLESAKNNTSEESSDNTIIKLNIPKDCYNARCL